MPTLTDDDVAEKVTAYLRTHPVRGIGGVIRAGVRNDAGIWYVPLSGVPDDADGRRLPEVEEGIEAAEGLNVLLVPTSNIIRLEPVWSMLRPLYVGLGDWHALCAEARLNPGKPRYDGGECVAIAEAIEQNPSVIPFDPPSYAKEVGAFFRRCEGVALK